MHCRGQYALQAVPGKSACCDNMCRTQDQRSLTADDSSPQMQQPVTRDRCAFRFSTLTISISVLLLMSGMTFSTAAQSTCKQCQKESASTA